jgi:hypothetical protein
MVKDPLRRHVIRAEGAPPADGGEARVVRLLPAPTAVVLGWLTDAGRRREWLDAEPEVRTARAVRSVRWGWPDGGRVTLHVHGAAGDGTRLSVRHRTPDAGAVPALEQQWSAAFARLERALADGA